jgi:polyhydroxybutyrate depolymerase
MITRRRFRTNRHRVCYVLAVLACSACATNAGDSGNVAGASQQGGANTARTESHSVRVGDLDRVFLVHRPAGCEPARGFPVVIMYHGGGSTASAALQETSWTQKADQACFLAVFPEGARPKPRSGAKFIGNPQSWNDGSGRLYAGEKNIDDVGFTKKMIEELRRLYPVDDSRIYATGYSNGSSMAYRVAVELSDTIAAVAPVASSGLRLPRASLSSPVSLIAINGKEDPYNPLQGGDVKLPGGTMDHKAPTRESIDRWAQMLKCSGKASDTVVAEGVSRLRYDKCEAGSEVELYLVDETGHTWPGGMSVLPERLVGKTTNRLRANDVIWEFFQRHNKVH